MNNKRRNRKGFTIVELSIVIAVIAILAAALIPAFGGIIKKSQETKLARDIDNAYSAYVLSAGADAEEDFIVQVGEAYYQITDGKADTDEYELQNGDFYWNGSAVVEYTAQGGSGT